MNKRLISLLLILVLLLTTGCEVVHKEPTVTDASLITLPSGAGAGTLPGAEQVTEGHTDGDNNGVCDGCGCSVLIYLDFYAINDLHGKFDDTDAQPGVDELTTYLKNARRTDDNVVLLSSGDMWQGGAESNLTEGRLITDWMNEMDFASMTLGNHEFDWGEDAIRSNRAMAEFPFLAINVIDRSTGKLASYCTPSVVVEQNGLQIGIIGAIGDCYSSISADQTQNVSFVVGEQLTELVKAESARLREEGVDYVVYSIHDGYGQSKNGVSKIYGNQISSYYDISLSNGYVDLVFEGHSHQSYVLLDTRGVYHLQGGGDNRGISHAEVAFNFANENSTVTEAEFLSKNAYQSLEDDPLIKELLKKYEAEVSAGQQVLGTVSRSLNRDELRGLLAQLYYQKGLEEFGDQYQLVLGGGFFSVRSPGYLASGSVTYAELLTILPFDNELVLCSIRGSDLRSKFFETSNENYFIAYGDYGASVKNSIDPNATYYLITDTYTSTYRYNNLTEIKRLGAGLYARDLLASYIASGNLSR